MPEETDPTVATCPICDRPIFIESRYIPGLCRTCGFVAHCEGY